MSKPIVIVADTVTKLDDRHRGNVLVAGSHGGIYPAYIAATAGVRAVILNNAGVGMDSAGVASLAYLEAIGMAAAAVGHDSARIGDGADMMRRGVISHANAVAVHLGVHPGQSCAHAAERLCAAPLAHAAPPSYAEARVALREAPGEPAVWGLDSNSLTVPDDKGRVLVIGSHGGILGGKPETALRVDALAAVYNDAGVGADGAGLSRLPPLDARGIAAATVDCMTARIGDARSAWETGVISHVNKVAASRGGRAGTTVKEFVRAIIAAGKKKAQ
jgi:hypothetical protein